MTEETTIIEFPLKAPDVLCNHRLARRSGYCQNGSGEGTEHKGYGRCKVHEEGVDGDRDELLKALGLNAIVVTAEMLTRDDQEYLFLVSNNALVIQRAKIVQEMANALVTPKEKKEMIEAVAKIDAILAKHTNEVQGEGDTRQTAAEADELKRLEAI